MPSLNLTTPINNLGYGVTGLNVLKSLVKIGVEVSLFPIGQISVTNEEDDIIVQQCLQRSRKYNPYSPSLRIWHQHDLSQHVGKGKHIGFPIFELNDFTEEEKHQLKCMDAIIVCSHWAKHVIEQVLPDCKVYVAPLGVDRTIFHDSKCSFRRSGARTIFLNVGKWEYRKGHDIIPDLFFESFNDTDDVELWMMNDNPFLSAEHQSKWEQYYLESDLGHKIKIIPRAETQQELAEIMCQADCGIFPSRAEGWNLEALEMMSMGKWVIITNYSAHSEFCREENSFQVPIEKLDWAKDDMWFNGHVGKWAKIGRDEAVAFSVAMQQFHYQMNDDSRVNVAGIETAKHFSWENCANSIMECVNDVHE